MAQKELPITLEEQIDMMKNVVKYPELKEYRKGGNRHTNKLPIWVTFSYTEFGTMSMMYNYLRGDLRKSVLTYLFHEKRYSKEIRNLWIHGLMVYEI